MESKSTDDNKIKFYEGPFYLLSNFSAHKVVFEGEEYMTSEHAYQVSKFSDIEIRKKIKEAPSAFLAREYGGSKNGRKEPFDKVSVMEKVMKAKLEQHDDVKRMLIKTADKIIEKNHPEDYFWGTGENGSGENMMGKIWMKIRKEIYGNN